VGFVFAQESKKQVLRSDVSSPRDFSTGTQGRSSKSRVHRSERVDLEGAFDSALWAEAAGRDHHRAGATTEAAVDFYDFPEYERFMEGARALDATTFLIALLAVTLGFGSGKLSAFSGATLTSVSVSCVSNAQTGGER
jgi:hypothetical protein